MLCKSPPAFLQLVLSEEMLTLILSTKVTPVVLPLGSVNFKYLWPCPLFTVSCILYLSAQLAALHFPGLRGENSTDTSHEWSVVILELEFELRLVWAGAAHRKICWGNISWQTPTNLSYRAKLLLPFRFLFLTHINGTLQRQKVRMFGHHLLMKWSKTLDGWLKKVFYKLWILTSYCFSWEHMFVFVFFTGFHLLS